ncbi:MarR family transcriptional regulator, partial [bacterium]|nr:MarR family transcriptional regulator [bacterium]
MNDVEQIRASIGELAGILARVGITQMKDLMNETSLSHSQMFALMQINSRGNCGVSQIADHLGTTDAASSQLVQRLVTLDLVERLESQEDRREKKISLTPRGKELVGRMVENRRNMIEELIRALPPEKQAVMIEAIGLLVKSAR